MRETLLHTSDYRELEESALIKETALKGKVYGGQNVLQEKKCLPLTVCCMMTIR